MSCELPRQSVLGVLNNLFLPHPSVPPFDVSHPGALSQSLIHMSRINRRSPYPSLSSSKPCPASGTGQALRDRPAGGGKSYKASQEVPFFLAAWALKMGLLCALEVHEENNNNKNKIKSLLTENS